MHATRADIVPVYSLGQSQMLDFCGACGLSRRIRTAVGVFWGRWGLPVPRRHDIIVVVGRPVPGGSPDLLCSHKSLIVCPLSGIRLSAAQEACADARAHLAGINVPTLHACPHKFLHVPWSMVVCTSEDSCRNGDAELSRQTLLLHAVVAKQDPSAGEVDKVQAAVLAALADLSSGTGT